MREYKFRAWDKEERKMFQPDTIATIHMNPTPFGLTIIDKDGDGACMKFVLMQFTGALDKNGKEIFEGDILSFVPVDSPKFGRHYRPFLVEWNDERGSFTFWYPRDAVEIIGNLYETPELLDGGSGS